MYQIFKYWNNWQISIFDKIILVFFTRSKYRLVINDEKVIFKFLVLSIAVALSKYHFVHISKKCINLESSQESANDLMTPIFILKVIFVRSSTNIGNFVIIQEKHGCHGKFLFLIGWNFKNLLLRSNNVQTFWISTNNVPYMRSSTKMSLTSKKCNGCLDPVNNMATMGTFNFWLAETLKIMCETTGSNNLLHSTNDVHCMWSPLQIFLNFFLFQWKKWRWFSETTDTLDPK